MYEEFFADYFKNKNLASELNKLNLDCNNKKIVIYGAGIVFDSLTENNVLSSLNIIAVADRKFPKGVQTQYKSYIGINGEDIKNYEPDIIIVSMIKDKEVIASINEDIYKNFENKPQILRLFSVFNTVFDGISKYASCFSPRIEEIKLIIWDMDETFWQGTLSEGEIQPIKENINIIKELTNRGIINSIASKNNFEDVKNKLEELNIWNYFVFPSISWDSKYKMVEEIITQIHLRPNNILFIDDNHLNLEEVKYYFPEINAATPQIISGILSHLSFKGKDDSNHSRLNQYKLLEKQSVAVKNFSDNKDFLMSCEIKVMISDIDEKNFERVFELINRTNQLNFTKIRFENKNDFKKILNNENYENKCIAAKDKIGDYGIIGFYCLDKINNTLLHYLFSCRTLNLNIEQFIYSKLNFPKIETVGDTITKLNTEDSPEWINIASSDISFNKEKENNTNIAKTKIFIQGGCDLEMLLHFFNDSDKYEIKENLARISLTNHTLRNDHTQCVKNTKILDFQTQERLVNKLPFLEMSLFKKDIFEENYDILIFSLLMDYWQDLCQEKNTGIKLNFNSYFLCAESLNESRLDFCKKNNILGIDKTFLETLRNDFIYYGKISAEEFKENLYWLTNNITRPIVLMNAAEIPEMIKSSDLERFKLFNKIVDEFVDNTKNTYLLDVRKFVTNRDDCLDTILHYKFHIYKTITEELNLILKEIKVNNLDLDYSVKG